VVPLDELIRLLEAVEREGTSLVELICGTAGPVPWTLYPGEYGVFDDTTSSQFYFHAHEGGAHEAGHFHTVRLFPDHTVHLVAISVGTDGWPQALFTLNLWAIGDAEAGAPELKRHVKRFSIDPRRGPPRVVRFVNLVFRAFEADIERLQEDKVAALAAYRRARPQDNPLEDRGFEILSRVDVNLRDRLAGRGTLASR
jgi:hypothetical protein